MRLSRRLAASALAQREALDHIVVLVMPAVTRGVRREQRGGLRLLHLVVAVTRTQQEGRNRRPHGLLAATELRDTPDDAVPAAHGYGERTARLRAVLIYDGNHMHAHPAGAEP